MVAHCFSGMASMIFRSRSSYGAEGAAQVARALRAGTNGFRSDVASLWPRLATSTCLDGRNSVAAEAALGPGRVRPGAPGAGIRGVWRWPPDG